MNTTFFIARRYLFARKSHNVINIISVISAAGIAVGCAALVIILSIYNGFDDLLKGMFESYTPDVVVAPLDSKVFTPSEQTLDYLVAREEIASVCEVLEETVFLKYGDREAIVTARGVDSLYQQVTGLAAYVSQGSFDLKDGELDQMVLGSSIARNLRINTKFVTPLEVYFPSRTARVSLTDPTAALKKVRVFPAGTISLEKDFDEQYVYMPIEALRTLLERDTEVSRLEIRLKPEALTAGGTVSKQLQNNIAEQFGSGFTVRNKYQQNESLYKMMTYEKLAIYLILLFVVLIISCNVFGSLSMLIIEKQGDIEILRSMGANDKMINRIFTTEGWMISLLGAAVGVIIGVAVCLAQQYLHIVRMPGNFITPYYPVHMQLTDLMLIFVSVAAIGYLMSHFVKAVRIKKQ
ncbi:MAG: ABC transporter permease [Bacteroidales bacterium]|nr:ABC transporter permease [Bacteroidales bacterium]